MNILITIGGALLILALIALPALQRRKPSKNQTDNPLGEAEVYIAYGRKKEAKIILEKYLLSNPGDPKAIELLKQAK